MTIRGKYSAGMVKRSFWFLEYKKMIGLLKSGMSFFEIKELNTRENIFSAPTEARANQIFNALARRAKALPKDFHDLFQRCDIGNQKLIALIGVMLTDSLFFEFVYEVYREKLIIGAGEIADSDISVFFRDKQMQNDRLAKWKDYTLKRLGRSYKVMLTESGILGTPPGARKIIKPILDDALVAQLKTHNLGPILRALTGVR